MNSPSVDISGLLETEGIGTVGTDIFTSKEPDTPNKCVTLYDTGGFEPDLTDVVCDKPTIQIKVRGEKGKGATAAYAVADTIKRYLHGLHNEDIDSVSRIILVKSMSDIIFLGYDDRDRVQYTLNFEIYRTGD